LQSLRFTKQASRDFTIAATTLLSTISNNFKHEKISPLMATRATNSTQHRNNSSRGPYPYSPIDAQH
jgi:hypothetical protein